MLFAILKQVLIRFSINGNKVSSCKLCLLSVFANFRYPEDRYHRIWKPASSLYSSTNSPVTIHTNANTTVPLKVLQTAVTDSNRLEFLQNDLVDGDYNYTVILYFLELNDTVTRIGQRMFHIYINNERKEENFDILANGSKYREVVFNVTAKGSLNLTLVKVSNGSEFGPICNAFEILQVRPRDQQTNYSDGKSNKLLPPFLFFVCFFNVKLNYTNIYASQFI